MKNPTAFRPHHLALAFLCLLSFLIITPTVHAQGTDLFESIDAYNVDITMNTDSSLTVVETIDYNFHDLERHGIYRFIPVKYDTGTYTRSNTITVDSVTVNDGEDVNYTSSMEGRNMQIKIGDPDFTVTGLQKYVITYRVDNAINFFNDHDELYWNAVGGEWPTDINKATVAVHFSPTAASGVRYTCYAGATGSKANCEKSDLIKDAAGQTGEAQFSQALIHPGEFLTFVVGLPKGILHQPTVMQRFLRFILSNWTYLIPFIVLLAMTFLWWTRGRDPKGRGTVIAEYEAPDSLTPVEVGTIYGEDVSNRFVSAEIIYLATKGYLKITRLEKEGFLGKADYRLDLLKAYEDLPALDQTLLSKIFSFGSAGEDGALKTVRISELKEKFHSELTSYTAAVYQDLVDKKYFPESPAKVKGKYISIGVGMIFLAFWLGFAIWLIISGIIVVLFGMVMGRRTKTGAETMEKIKGLKLFLEVTEKERIKFHNAPEKNPQLFEKFLPFAMALNVEKEWAGQFADMYLEPPAWYSSTTSGTFNAIYLTNSLNDFSSRAETNMAATPASQGSSGFGGGGFSGGGGGGGGGGSW